MLPNLASLNPKFPIFHPFAGYSRPHFGQRTQISLNTIQITGSKPCSSSSFNFSNGNLFNDLGPFKMGFSQLGCDEFCVLADSDGGGGGLGGFGDGNSGGRGEGGGGGGGGASPDSDGNDWSFLSWCLRSFLICLGWIFACLACVCFLILVQLSRVMKRLESINPIRSPFWWVFGFCLIVSGAQALLQDYWSTVVFLAYDVFFTKFCNGVAFVIFLALFCCIPILVIAYAVAIQKGASEDDISRLPKYRYCQDSPLRKLYNDKKQEVLGARVGSSNNDELALLPENSECCICLSRYVDGAELYALPCNHYFHCRCISKWLRIKASCPLCKFSIRGGDTLV